MAVQGIILPQREARVRLKRWWLMAALVAALGTLLLVGTGFLMVHGVQNNIGVGAVGSRLDDSPYSPLLVADDCDGGDHNGVLVASYYVCKVILNIDVKY